MVIVKKSYCFILAVLIMVLNCIIPSKAAEKPLFSISNAEGSLGEEVSLEIRIDNNPGIISYLLEISYDANSLELVSAEKGDCFDSFYGPTDNNPLTITWSDGLGGNRFDNGIMPHHKGCRDTAQIHRHHHRHHFRARDTERAAHRRSAVLWYPRKRRQSLSEPCSRSELWRQ